MVTSGWPESEFVLHSLSGDLWFQALLFSLQAILALALLVGFKTPIVTVLSFFLLFSLHLRNGYILNAGDVLLRLLLFWSIFLPLGERWSIDAALKGTTAPARRIADAATAAILLQVLIIYGLNAYHKIQGGRWISGEALQYVFLVDRFMTPIGQLVAHFPSLLPWLTKGWLALIVIAPLLLVTTGRLRIALVGAFAMGHLGMYLFMQLGFFPIISIIALLAFLPRRFWDLAETRILVPLSVTAPARRVALLIATPQNGTQTPEPETETDSANDNDNEKRPPIWQRIPPRWAATPRHVVASVFLFLLLLSTATSAGIVVLPDEHAGDFAIRERQWMMFATPSTSNAWVTAPARLESSTVIDAIHIERGKWDEPHYLDAPHPDFRWRKYLDAVSHPYRTHLLLPFAEHLCDRWNSANDDKMEALTIYRFDRPINLDGPDPPPNRYELIYHECPQVEADRRLGRP